MSNIDMGFICDVCGRAVHGFTFVNGMKFCAKCYQETFGNLEQEGFDKGYKKALDECEEQLAEKDKEIEKLRKESEDYVIIERNFYNNLQEQLTEMKQIKEMLKQSRHQICEEIREKTQYFDDCWKIKEILDQIEGESK